MTGTPLLDEHVDHEVFFGWKTRESRTNTPNYEYCPCFGPLPSLPPGPLVRKA